jgi:serine/threonine-protein kinase
MTAPLTTSRTRTIAPDVQPDRANRSTSSGTTTIPGDLLKEQLLRVQLLNVVGGIVWTIMFAMDFNLALHGDRGPYASLIEGTCAAVSFLVAAYTRYGRGADRLRIKAGVAVMVPHAFAVALLNSWVAQSTTMRPLSGITVLILVFGMLAPAKPASILAGGLVAASMDPLGVWIAHLRGLPVPSVLGTFLMFLPNYVCAVLAVVPARILYRLVRQVGQARAVGSYHLVQRLGEGGMGEVWLARHMLLARCAAIKLIRPENLGHPRSEKAATTLGRFEREARATAALTSVHTIRLFDFGHTDDGAFYYVMELLHGRDLESLVREFGPLPAERAVYLLRQVCRSLAEAHARGLIHRDVKPANIYVCRMGLEYDFVKVLDFGLVKHEDASDAPTLMTVAQTTVGTPAYMAPEVILGERDVDRRIDIYALGCVAYYLLTGVSVFAGETPMKMLLQHVEGQPIPPSQRSEQHVPRALDAFVMACLQKDPRQRPADAETLLRMLDECDTSAWDQKAAEAWWAGHLPDLAGALTRASGSVDVTSAALAIG